MVRLSELHCSSDVSPEQLSLHPLSMRLGVNAQNKLQAPFFSGTFERMASDDIVHCNGKEQADSDSALGQL